MAQDVHEFLIVELAGQRLGLPAPMVRELLRAAAITPLPGGPSLVEGVISIRGRVVPVFDLRQWLRLPARPVEPADHLVVVGTGEEAAVVRVDRALQLARLEAAPGNSGSRVVQHAGALVVLPDLAAFLAQGHAVLECSKVEIQNPNVEIRNPKLETVVEAAP